MAGWSQLPPELVVLIANCLETTFDVLRFRSVCSVWLSSVPPKVYPFPMYLPPPITKTQQSQLHISRNTFYLIRLFNGVGDRSLTPACWLVKTDSSKMRLLNPLTDSELPNLPENFPKVLDLTNFRVSELGHEYIDGDLNFNHPLWSQYMDVPRHLDYKRKVIFLRASGNGDDLIMTACCSRSPRFLRPGENECILLENVKSIEDIVPFDGKFYAIDEEGTIIVLDRYLNVSFLGGLSSGIGYRSRPYRARKSLVKSGDSLLAVEKLWNPCANTTSACCRSISFRVFKMNEEEHEWDEMPSLGDQILFLSIHQAILAPCCCGSGRGNLIFCSERLPDGCDYTFVFDLKTGATRLLELP